MLKGKGDMIMSFFDEFKEDAKVFAAKASRQVNKTYEISKLKAEKLRIKSRIDTSYQNLGEALYAARKTGEDATETVDPIYTQLDADFARIEEIYKEIENVKAIYDGEYAEEEDDEEYEEVVDEEVENADEEEKEEEPAKASDNGISLDAD